MSLLKHERCHTRGEVAFVAHDVLRPPPMISKITWLRNLVLLVAVGVFLQTAACKSKPAEGPAEKAGKKVDQAGEDVKDTAKKAGDDVDEATKKKP
ncbi:hypothetical protein BH09MYX1_BH09MYX1_00010 [soil metagenome]